jgi:hypothetical protein
LPIDGAADDFSYYDLLKMMRAYDYCRHAATLLPPRRRFAITAAIADLFALRFRHGDLISDLIIFAFRRLFSYYIC